MKTKLTGCHVFALRGYGIKIDENSKFFVRPTPAFGTGEKWRGPFRSLQHASTSIARQQQRHVVERLRRQKNYKIAQRSLHR